MVSNHKPLLHFHDLQQQPHSVTPNLQGDLETVDLSELFPKPQLSPNSCATKHLNPGIQDKMCLI